LGNRRGAGETASLTLATFACTESRVQLEMVSRSCPVCGAGDRAKVFAQAAFDTQALGNFAFSSRKTPEYMHYRLLECQECDLLYANPLPTREALERAYRDAAFDSGEEAKYASFAYAALLPDITRRLPSLHGALDIGTGDGAFLERLLEQGFQGVVGVEPSAAPVASASPTVRGLIRQGAFSPKDFAPGSKSLVTCFQTMEHVYDPLSLCRDAWSILRPGGALLLVCHNRRAVSARVLGERSPIFDIEHLQLFSPRSLRYALEVSGYRQIRTSTLFNRYPLRYWMKLLPIPPKLKASLMSRLRKSRIGALPVRLPAGNLAAVGYKAS
jgi:SAM-dependent methyltransferase